MSAELPVDLTSEPGLTPAQVAKMLPGYRAGTKRHPSSIARFITAGALTRSGRRVKLAAVRVGGGWVTTASAVRRFIADQQEGATTEAEAPARGPSARMRASVAASEELKRLGC